jgi:plasmid stabilization system protein ParE
MKLRLLPQAISDLDAISEPLLSRIVNRLEVLKEFPEMGKLMSGPFEDYRSSVVGFFRAFYRIRPGEIVEVANIRDCRRDFPPRA